MNSINVNKINPNKIFFTSLFFLATSLSALAQNSTINAAAFKQAIATPKAQVLDVRTATEFNGFELPRKIYDEDGWIENFSVRANPYVMHPISVKSDVKLSREV